MNPVIGLDIAKGESQGQAFLDKGQPYGKSFTIIHTREGLEGFLRSLKDVEVLARKQPTVILVTRFLDEQHYLYIMVNPILSFGSLLC